MESAAYSFPTRQTLEFLEPLLRPGSRLLEVGCGEGELAAALQARGHAVTALDVDEQAVASAAARGVPAIRADFLDATPVAVGPVDAVLFTRSLHHVADLALALRRAASLLVGGGAILVDDWAWDAVDETTAVWASGICRICVAAFGGEPWIDPESPHERWWDEHGDAHHALHRGGAMLAACEALGDVDHVERVPYFFRYVLRHATPDRDAVCESVWHAERAAVAAGLIRPVGLRWRVTPRPSPPGKPPGASRETGG